MIRKDSGFTLFFAVFLLLQVLCFRIAAQQENAIVDSLQHFLKQQSLDTTRIKILAVVSNEFRRIQKFDEALKSGNEAPELSKRLSFVPNENYIKRILTHNGNDDN